MFHVWTAAEKRARDQRCIVDTKESDDGGFAKHVTNRDTIGT